MSVLGKRPVKLQPLPPFWPSVEQARLTRLKRGTRAAMAISCLVSISSLCLLVNAAGVWGMAQGLVLLANGALLMAQWHLLTCLARLSA